MSTIFPFNKSFYGVPEFRNTFIEENDDCSIAIAKKVIYIPEEKKLILPAEFSCSDLVMLAEATFCA